MIRYPPLQSSVRATGHWQSYSEHWTWESQGAHLCNQWVSPPIGVPWKIPQIDWLPLRVSARSFTSWLEIMNILYIYIYTWLHIHVIFFLDHIDQLVWWQWIGVFSYGSSDKNRKEHGYSTTPQKDEFPRQKSWGNAVSYPLGGSEIEIDRDMEVSHFAGVPPTHPFYWGYPFVRNPQSSVAANMWAPALPAFSYSWSASTKR